MRFNNLTIATALVLTSACGGGSDSGNSSIPQRTAPTNSQDTTNNTTPATKDLSIKLIEKNTCGVESVALDAKLVIHNEDFSTKEIVEADENGSLIYTSTNDYEDISVIYTLQGEKEYNDISVKTIIQQPVQEANPIVVDIQNEEGCNCQDFNSKVFSSYSLNASTQGLVTMEPSPMVKIESRVEDEFSLVTGRVCTPINEQWPTIATGMYFSQDDQAFGELFTHEDLGDFTEMQTLEVESSGQKIHYHVINSHKFENISSFAYSLDNKGLSYFNNTQMFAFPSDYFSKYQASFTASNNVDLATEYDVTQVGAWHTLTVEDFNTSLIVELPEISSQQIEQSIDLTNNMFNFTFLENIDRVARYYFAENHYGRDIHWSVVSSAEGYLHHTTDLDLSSVLTDEEKDYPLPKIYFN